MKKVFFAFAAIALLAGPAVAQEKAAADKKKDKKEATCNKGAEAGCCKSAQTAKSKSCCVGMPSKASALKSAAADKKPAKPAAKG